MQVENIKLLVFDIVEWYKKKYSTNIKITKQLSNVKIESVEYTGIGFFVYIRPGNDALKEGFFSIDDSELSFPVDGPKIFSPSIDGFGEVLLWGKEGYVSSLEIYTSGNFFGKDLSEYTIELCED